MSEDKMLNRVRALLNQAEDPAATPEESAAFSAKAAQLMMDYNIDEALARARTETREKPIDRRVEFMDPYASKQRNLYYVVLLAFGGTGVAYERAGRTFMDVFAFEADLTAVEVIYTSLLLQASHHTCRTPNNVNARSWRVSFWAGFTSTINSRFKAAKAETVKSKAPGTDIVLRSREVEVRDAMRVAHPNTRTVRRTTHVTSKDGYDAGVRAGNRANLHNTKQAGQARRTALS
jgi:hypothetical protein